ncbi:MAG: tetratricopeptide repeat protein [Bacteroidetes bacterium]|nr:tetratricopeptide repeat protein [Bacteroidota bacterium]
MELKYKFKEAYFFRGRSNYFLNDYKGAIVDCMKAIELDPKYSDSYYYRGLSYLLLDEKNKGCLDLRKAGELGVSEDYDMIKKFCQ